jgi:putative methanogenesis marker protein 3
MANAETIDVMVDGIKFKVHKGEKLSSILKKAHNDKDPGSLILAGHKEDDDFIFYKKIEIISTKGKIIIKFDSKNNYLADIIESLLNDPTKIQNEDVNFISLETRVSNLKGKYKEYELPKGEIFLDVVGSDQNDARVIISKKSHTAYYSLNQPEPIGIIVSGHEILEGLNCEDGIEIIPQEIIEPSNLFSFKRIDDLDTSIIDDDTHIISELDIDLFDSTLNEGELFLHSFKDNTIEVSNFTGTFISTQGLKGFLIEDNDTSSERRTGFVTLRKEGVNQGSYYFYKKNTSESKSHIIIGKIVKGIHLIDFAEVGDRLSFSSSLKLVDCDGMTQKKAQDYIEDIGVHQIRKGDESDDAIVVSHSPSSFKIGKSESIQTLGLRESDIIKITLFNDAAPDTIRFFNNISGLTIGKIGKLMIEQSFSTILGAILLSGDRSRIIIPNIKPENIPRSRVETGSIGITNSVVDRMGMIGIRMEDSDEFGSTCENFDCTNSIGIIDKNSIELLKRYKKGQIIYFMNTGENATNSL